MSSTSFVLTPVLFFRCYPQEQKSHAALFWFGLGANIAAQGGAALLQSLWGRSLDHLVAAGSIDYRAVVRDGLSKEGASAFLTAPKWFSRVLMNAP